jgi:hypothetical protein
MLGKGVQIWQIFPTPPTLGSEEVYERDLPPNSAQLRLRNQVEHTPEAAEVVGKWESRAFCGISKQIGKLGV